LTCPLCNQKGEDDWYVLVDCEVSVEARRAAGLESIVEARVQQVNNAQEMVHAICSGEDKEMAGIFAMLTWTLCEII
jgi:hypothetical protein